MSRSPPTLAALEQQLEALRREFFAEADRVDPRTATEDEVRALDAKALPMKALIEQIRTMRPIPYLRRELEAARTMEREVAGSDIERELYRSNADEIEALLAVRLQARAAEWRKRGVVAAAIVLLAAALGLAWRLVA